MPKLTQKEAIARLPKNVKTRIDMTVFKYDGWSKPTRIRCLKHKRFVSPTFQSLSKGRINCPDCRTDKNRERGQRMIKQDGHTGVDISTALGSWRPLQNLHQSEE